MTEVSRAAWSNRLGFILAAAGSAIGLGNLWKFPYIVGTNGGGAFVLIYLICIALIGAPVLIAELFIGSRGRANTVKSYENVHKPKSFWRISGYLGLISAFVIVTFYSVIGGWILDFEYKTLINEFGHKSESEIKETLGQLFANPLRQVGLLLCFVTLEGAIVIGGIKAGIEKWNRILMPGLVMILIGLLLYSFSLPGAGQAWAFLFSFDTDQLSWSGVLEAVGHCFFTLSVAVGVMVTYGSYLNPKENIVRMAFSVALVDTVLALTAGVVIFSCVFSFGIEPASGPTLIFQTLPILFSKMTGGYFIAVFFFLLVAFTALTSGVSIYEVVVTYCVETFGWERVRTTVVIGIAIFLVGLLSAFSTNILSGFLIFGQTCFDFFDHLTSKYFLPISGLMTAIFFGWVLADKALNELAPNATQRVYLVICSRYVAPASIMVIFIMQLLGKL